jgi:ribosomal protein S3AE
MKERSLQNAKNKGLKKDIIDIQEKAIYESHENKLVYTYVLKDIQKNIYKIGKTAFMPGLRACVLGQSTQ